MNDTTKKSSCFAIVIWSTLAAFYFYQFIARSSFITVLSNEFMQYFGIDATGLGLLGSCYYWIYTLMQIPAGIIVDKYSTKLVAVLATLICSLGLFILILTSNSYVAGFGEMLIGFGSAFAFVLVVKAITQWFHAGRVAIMTSLTMSIGCLGPVLGGPGVAYIARSHNWIDVIRIYCFVGVGLAALIWFVVKDKKSEDKNERVSKSVDAELSLMESVKLVLCSGQAWVLGLMTMAVYAPLSALGDLWGVTFIKVAYGLSPEMSALANNMLYLGVVIGSPIFAYAATICRSFKKPMIVGVIGAFLSLLVIVYFSNYVNTFWLFVLFFAMGFSCGSMLAYPLGLALFPKSIGATITGFINMMSMVSGIILLPAVGGTVKYFWNGATENGLPVYTISDFRWGLTWVLAFLGFGIILSYFIKDRSPNRN